MAITREQCRGCEDDFYNHGNRSHTGRCWSAESGMMKVRYRTGTWTQPTQPGAFIEVRVPSCYRQKGEHFSDSLPSFVQARHVVRLRDREREHAPAALHPGDETAADRDGWEF